MLEVLVTLVITAIGLLGLAGVQARLQVTELEAYQRAQAIILMNDMANRLASNRAGAASYVTGAAAPLGAGASCPSAAATQIQRDQRDWCNALQGASETQDGNTLGAMIGGRGCVEALPDDTYLITVAWQGLTPLGALASACGQNQYDTVASACVGDRCRRAVSTLVRIGKLAD